MKKIISIGLLVCATFMFVNFSYAGTISYIGAKSKWKYDVIELQIGTDTDLLWGIDPDGPSGSQKGHLWSSVGYSSYDWNIFSNTTDWTWGNAVFGDISDLYYPGSYSTYWQPNTDLALQQSFTVASQPTTPLTMDVGSDNGFVIFLNGVQLAKENEEGYTSNPYAQSNPQWEYSFSIDPTLLNLGENILQVLAEDHESANDHTFFDMELYYTPVPEPGTMLLFGFGLLGLAGLRRYICQK